MNSFTYMDHVSALTYVSHVLLQLVITKYFCNPITIKDIEVIVLNSPLEEISCPDSLLENSNNCINKNMTIKKTGRDPPPIRAQSTDCPDTQTRYKGEK